MSYLLPHLTSGWDVDQAIVTEEEKVIVIRFGHDYDGTCMEMDEVLYVSVCLSVCLSLSLSLSLCL